MGLRNLIERTYSGRLTAYRRVFREEGGRTVEKELPFLENAACALSWGGNQRQRGAALKQGLVPEIAYEAQIFAAPELDIPAGSRVVVTQDGATREFVTCGEAVIYPTHQQIMVSRRGRA